MQYYKHQRSGRYPQAAEHGSAGDLVLSFVRNWRHRRRVMSKAVKKIDPELDARKSGSFKIGGVIDVHRLGFGAMRITGKGIFGPPQDRDEAVATLKRVPELCINFIDTADSYGPDVSEELIREVLYPYDGLLIATKAGLERPGPSVWKVNGNPKRLRERAIKSCEKLGVEQIGLWQLHRIDPKVPADEQFGAIRQMIDDGIIRQAGLSEVTIADIETASKLFPVATVQNRYNLVDRGQRGRARILRGERHRIHSVVPARGRRSRQARHHSRRPSPAGIAPPRARLRSPGC